jgi:hypothetical protein
MKRGQSRRNSRVMVVREDNHRDILRQDLDHLGTLGQLLRRVDDDPVESRGELLDRPPASK